MPLKTGELIRGNAEQLWQQGEFTKHENTKTAELTLR